MAKARVGIKTEKTYHLELTEEEALFLARVFSKISGSVDSGPRKHSDAISKALYEHGIHWSDSKDKFIGSLNAIDYLGE